MEIIKPKIDTNEYKYIILDNKLKVLLIYDRNTHMSSAAMNVNVGFYNDPEHAQGLAHFLEHMLFMGTTKFPQENYFNEFINKSGGTMNAHTMEESTTYYFEVLNKYFIDSIDIFSNFFVEPLLSKNAVEREINAINSEYLKNTPVDIVRVLSVLKAVMDNKDHPYHNFGFGNTKTLLKPDIRKTLKEFYNKYYSSNIMDLVILSNNSIDEIEPKIIEMFSKIPNKNIDIPCKIDTLPFTQPKFIKVVPIENSNVLYLFFQIPNVDKYYKYKPLQYILHLLDHKGAGGIYDVLKSHHYATKIGSGIYESDTSSHLLGINIKLTLKGFEKYEHVLGIVESYIQLIKTNEFSNFLLDEMKILNDINFNYSTIDEKISYVSNLSMNMLKYKIEDTIYGDYIVDVNNKKKSKHIITSCLQFVDINKSIIVLSSKKFSKNNNLKEKWFDTEYINIPFTKFKNIDQKIKNELKLPIKNTFIPYDLKVNKTINNNQIIPTKFSSNIWYKPDNFGIPKVFIDVILYTNEPLKTPENYLLFDMYLTLFTRHNYEKFYYANMCETGISIIYDINFIIITFSGFNNNIHKIIELFMNSFFTFTDHITQSMFDSTMNECRDDLENFIYEPLSTIATERVSSSIYMRDYSNDKLLNTIDNVKYENIKEPIKWLYKNCGLKIFVYGNINEDILNLTKQFDIFSNGTELIKNENKIVKLHAGESQIYIIKSRNSENDNNLIYLFYEIGNIIKKTSDDWQTNLLCTYFIRTFVKEKFFTELRTKEQSGYIVTSFLKTFLSENGYLYGLSFMVQSPHIDPITLRVRIKNFVVSMYHLLLELNTPVNLPKFEQFKNNIKLILEQKFVSQYEEHNFIFNEILSNEFAFDYKKILIDNIDSLDINTLIKFYELYFISKDTRKVRICEIYKNIK
jgi:insulysin